MTTTAEPHSTMIAGYVYRADTYCPDCTLAILLDEQGIEGHGLSYVPSQAIDRIGISTLGGQVYADEYNWDSDNFPKVILRPCEPFTCGRCGKGNPLIAGTYARESDGATLLYHSTAFYIDASYALNTAGTWWRRVDDEAERYALEEYLGGGLYPGENVEIH
jgi:hypothetical protein